MEEIIIIALTCAFILGFFILRDHFDKKDYIKITVRRVGMHTTARGNTYDLSEYCIDNNNDLYSFNPYTHELNRRKGKDTLRCSNLSLDKQGRIVNSFRDTQGNKVTIRRDYITFDILGMSGRPAVELYMRKTTDRHFKLVNHEVSNA